MNRLKTLKSFLKTLPLLSVLATGLMLTPVMASADNDRGHNKHKYSQDRGHSQHKTGHKKHVYNDQGRSHGKRQAGHNKHKPKHHRNNWRGYYTEHHYKSHDHHSHRSYRQPIYIVNDHHYNDHYIGFDRLGFMIGLHTGNLDITFHD